MMATLNSTQHNLLPTPASPAPATMLDPRPSDVEPVQAMVPPRTAQPSSLVTPSRRHKPSPRVARLFRSLFRTLPVFNHGCKIPAPCKLALPNLEEGSILRGGRRNLSGVKITGTLFGYRKSRVSLSIQEMPQCLPSLIVELAIPTHVLLRDITSGMVRIALECEKKPEHKPGRLLDEPLWTMFCNGKKSGYGVKRETTENDLSLMEVLKSVSMGAGVLPGRSDTEGPDGELAYVRASFEHVVVSKDSEALYMQGPEETTGPDLTIFFIRI